LCRAYRPHKSFYAPFFLLRFIQTRHRQFLNYCLILFILGAVHLTNFFISKHAGLVFEGRWVAEFDPVKSFIYITSPNAIFPLFGYFISIIYRTGLDIIHIGLNTTPIYQRSRLFGVDSSYFSRLYEHRNKNIDNWVFLYELLSAFLF
jgi:hypothetical protein